jgi:hypothetical protein
MSRAFPMNLSRIDNTTPIPKPGLKKQPTVEKDLGIMDINIDTLIYVFYFP